jgi:hypothetical protein
VCGNSRRSTSCEAMTFVPATEIQGSRVVNAKEDNLGKIEEVMIDSERGRITLYFLLPACLVWVINYLRSPGNLLSIISVTIFLCWTNPS